MEIGLAAIVSSEADTGSQVARILLALNQVEDAACSTIKIPPLYLSMRVASWVPDPVANDPASDTYLVVIGQAWSGSTALTPTRLLQDYLRDGERSFNRLGGSFALLIWQPGRKQLDIVMDRLATKKLYYWCGSDRAVIASELLALLAHPSIPNELDAAAAEQFLITNHLVDTRTLVAGVRIFPPGSVSTLSSSGVATRIYWSPKIEPAHDDGLDPWADRLGDVLKAAVQARCTGQPIYLPLSGGLDSRSVAAFLPPSVARSARTCSFGPGYCYDVRYGKRIARAMHAQFEHLELPRDFFRTYLDPVQRLCDGEVSIEGLPIYRLLGFGSPGHTLLTGYLGDALSGSHLLGRSAGLNHDGISPDTVWRRHYQRLGFSESQLAATLNPERYHSVKGSTRQAMEQALAAAEAPSMDEKALAVELAHRQSRYISYFGRLLSTRYRVEHPFLDNDVLDTFLALPLAHRYAQRAYRRMLTRHAARLASIPENKTNRPVTHADRYGITHFVKRPIGPRLPAALEWRFNLLCRHINSILVSASGGWVGDLDRKHYTHHDLNIRKLDPDWFYQTAIDHPLAAEWFQRETLERMFHEHLSGRYNHATRINNVVAFLTAADKVRSRGKTIEC